MFTPHLFASYDLSQNRDFTPEGRLGSAELLRLRAAFFVTGTREDASRGALDMLHKKMELEGACLPAETLM